MPSTKDLKLMTLLIPTRRRSWHGAMALAPIAATAAAQVQEITSLNGMSAVTRP